MTLTHTCEARTCRVAEIFDDAASAALFAEYSAECANPFLGETAPRRDSYENLEALGFGQCFSAREDGVLVGFAFSLRCVLPHYGVSKATVESLFVSQSARPRGLGMKLMDAVEDDALGVGCTEILYSAPVDSQLAKLLFLCVDEYHHTGYAFTRRLA